MATRTDGSAPIIVTAALASGDFAWLDGLRQRHFPPERNLIPAHLTMFHHLPPSLLGELERRLRDEAAGDRPAGALSGVMMLGRGVAFRVHSPDLDAIRGRLAAAFADLLVPQDSAGWRAHVTVQNKVPPAQAKALHAALSADFAPRPLAVAGLAAHWYRGGPWETIGTWRFRGGGAR